MQAGTLVALTPLDGAAQVRHLHVTTEIDDLLAGRKPETGFPTWLSDPLIGRFLVGQCMWACLSKEPDRKVDVDLKRLVDAGEIWTLRVANVRKRINGWRVFGMFLHHNHFIGLRAYVRDDLKNQAEWKSAIDQTKKDWITILGTASPISAQQLDAYLSEPYRDVTDKY